MKPALTEWMVEYAGQKPLSGVAWLAQGNEILFQQAWDLADRTRQRPNQIDTPFPIASLSKAFTAGAVMKLAKSLQIDLHAPCLPYLPDWVSISAEISLHQLLCHSSGLPDYRLEEGEKLHELFAQPLSPREFGQKFLGHEPLALAGTRFHYCNPGYYLLGQFIEQQSGKSFGAYLQESLFAPLKLIDTCLDDPESPPANRAKAYTLSEKKIVPAPITDARNFYPQGGLISTAPDLHRWTMSWLEPGFWSREELDNVLAPHVLVPHGKMNIHYGYGWHILRRHERFCMGHGGSHWGYVSHLEIYPEEGLIGIVLCNQDHVDSMLVADAMFCAFFGEKLPSLAK